MKAGQSFADAAKAGDLAVLASVPMIRASQQIDARVFSTAFGLAEGDIAVAPDSNGEPWVVKVDKVEPVAAEVASTLKPQIDSQVTESLQDDIREVFARAINREVTVHENQKALDSYFESLTQTEDQ